MHLLMVHRATVTPRGAGKAGEHRMMLRSPDNHDQVEVMPADNWSGEVVLFTWQAAFDGEVHVVEARGSAQNSQLLERQLHAQRRSCLNSI